MFAGHRCIFELSCVHAFFSSSSYFSFRTTKTIQKKKFNDFFLIVLHPSFSSLIFHYCLLFLRESMLFLLCEYMRWRWRWCDRLHFPNAHFIPRQKNHGCCCCLTVLAIFIFFFFVSLSFVSLSWRLIYLTLTASVYPVVVNHSVRSCYFLSLSISLSIFRSSSLSACTASFYFIHLPMGLMQKINNIVANIAWKKREEKLNFGLHLWLS